MPLKHSGLHALQQHGDLDVLKHLSFVFPNTPPGTQKGPYFESSGMEVFKNHPTPE